MRKVESYKTIHSAWEFRDLLLVNLQSEWHHEGNCVDCSCSLVALRKGYKFSRVQLILHFLHLFLAADTWVIRQNSTETQTNHYIRNYQTIVCISFWIGEWQKKKLYLNNESVDCAANLSYQFSREWVINAW